MKTNGMLSGAQKRVYDSLVSFGLPMMKKKDACAHVMKQLKIKNPTVYPVLSVLVEKGYLEVPKHGLLKIAEHPPKQDKREEKLNMRNLSDNFTIEIESGIPVPEFVFRNTLMTKMIETFTKMKVGDSFPYNIKNVSTVSNAINKYLLTEKHKNFIKRKMTVDSGRCWRTK